MIILWIYVLFAHASALPSGTSRHRYVTTEKSIEDLKSDMEKIVTKLPMNMREEIMGSSKKEKAGGYFDVLSKDPDSTYIIGNKDKKRYRVRIKPKTKNKGDSSSSVSGSQEYNSSFYTPSSKTRHVKYKGSDENNKNIIRTSSHGFRQINKGDHTLNDDGSRSYEFSSENQKKGKERNNHSHEYEREIKKYKIRNKARLNQSYGINEEYSTGTKEIKKKKKKNFGTHTKEYITADKVIKKIKNNGNSENQHLVDFNEHSGIDSDQLISSNNDKDRFTDEEFDYEFDTDHVIKNKPRIVSNPNAALSSEKRIHKKKINKKIPKIKKGKIVTKQRIVSVEDDDDDDNENFEIINDHEIVSHNEKGRDKNNKIKHGLNTDLLINNNGKPIIRTKPSIESISDEFTSNSKEKPKSKRKRIKTQQRVISFNDDANGNFGIKTERFIDNDAQKNKIKNEKINNGHNTEELANIDGGHSTLTDPILVYNSHEIIPKSKEIAKINKAGPRTQHRQVSDNYDANFDNNNEQIIPSAIKLGNNANGKYQIDHDELKVSNNEKINNANDNHVIDTNKFISNDEEEPKKILRNQKENSVNNSPQPDKHDGNKSEHNGSNNSPSIFADVEDDENEKINFGLIPDQLLNNGDELSNDTKPNFELIADEPIIINKEIEKDTEGNVGINNEQRLEGDSGNSKENHGVNTEQLSTNDDNIKDNINFVFDADQLENNDTDVDNEVKKILDIIYKQIEAEKGNYSINIDQPEISDNEDNHDENENFELNTDLPINNDTGLNNHGHNESKVNSDEPVDSDKDDNDTREYAANVNQSIVGHNDNANGSYEINTEQLIANNKTIGSNGDELIEGDKESINYTNDNIELETDQFIPTDNENDRNTSVVSKVKIDDFLEGDNDTVNGSNGSTEQPVVNDDDEANVNLTVDTDPFTDISNIENNDNTTEKIEINTDQDILKDNDINITRSANESRIIHIDQLISSTNGTDNNTNASLEVKTDRPIDRNDIYTKLDSQTDENDVSNAIANQLLDELLDIDDLDNKYTTTVNYDVTTGQSRLDTREATDPVHISTKMPILRSNDGDKSINSKKIEPKTRTQKKKHEESNDKDILSICKDLKLKPQDIWLLGNKYFGLDITKPDHLERFKQLYVDFIANLRNDTEREYLSTVSSVVDLLGKDKDADLAFTESMRSVDDVTPKPIFSNIDDDQAGITVSGSKGLQKLSGAVKEGLNVLDHLINSKHDANEPKLIGNEDNLPNAFQLDPPVIVPQHKQSNPSRDVLKAAGKESGSKQHNLVTDNEVLDAFGITPITISDDEQKITPNIDKLWDLFLKVQNSRNKNTVKPVSECDSDCESVEEQSKGEDDFKPVLKQYPAYAVAIAEADKLSKDLMRNPEFYEKKSPEEELIDKYKKSQPLSPDGYREIPSTKQVEVTTEPVTDSQKFTTNPFVISPVTVHQVDPQRTNLEDPKPNNVDPQYDFEGVQPFKNSLQRPKNETTKNNNPYYDKELSDILDLLAPQPIKYKRPTTSDDWLTAQPTLASKINQHPTRTNDKSLSEIKEKLDSINIDPLWLDKLNAFGWPNVENFTNRETILPSVTPSPNESETGYTEINQPTQSMVSKTRNTIGENYYEDKFQSTTIVNTIGSITPAYTIINNNIIKDKLIDTYNDPNVQEDDDLSMLQDVYKPITYNNDKNEKHMRKELDKHLLRYEKQRYPTTISDSTLVTLIQTKKIQKPFDKEYERAPKSLFKQNNRNPKPKWHTVERDRNKIKPKLSNYEQIYDYNEFVPIIDEEPPMSDILEEQGDDLSKLVDIIIYVMNYAKSSTLNQKLLKLLYHILIEESKAPMHGKKESTLSDEEVKKLRKYYFTVLSLINTYSEPLTGEQERLQQDYLQPTNVNYEDLTRLKQQSENSMNELDTEESDVINNRKIDPQIVKYKDRSVSPTKQKTYPKPDERPNLPYILDRNPETRYNNKYSTPKIQLKSKADIDESLKYYGNAFNSEKLPQLDNDSSEAQKEYILKRKNLMKLLKNMNYPDEFINTNVDKLLAILERKRQDNIYRNNQNNKLKIMGLNRPIQEENTAALQDKNPKNVVVKLPLKNQKPNIPIRKIIKALPPEIKDEVDRYVILPSFSESPPPTSASKEEEDEFDKIYLLQYPVVIEGEDVIYGFPSSSNPSSTMDNLLYNTNVNPDNHQDLRIWSTKESSENFKQKFINKPSKPDITIEPKFKKPENKENNQLFIGYTYEESDELPENVYNFGRPPNSQQQYLNPQKSKNIQWKPTETVNQINLDSKQPQDIDFKFVPDLENKFNAPPIQTPNNIDDQTQFYLSTVNLIPDLWSNSYNTSETDLTPEGILAVPKVDFNRIYYNLVSGILRDEMTKVYQFLILNEIPIPTILNTLEKIKLSMIMSMKVNGECLDDDINIFIEKLKSVVEQQVLVPLKSDSPPLSKY